MHQIYLHGKCVNLSNGKELKFTVTISLPNLFGSRGAYGCIIAARSVDRECHWRQRSTRDTSSVLSVTMLMPMQVMKIGHWTTVR